MTAHTIELIDLKGNVVAPFGRIEAPDELAALKKAASKYSNTLKRLALPGYRLRAGATIKTLVELKAGKQ
jgi:hypothetical protein